MAERLGIDHQRLQQFITSSTWDYTAVRRNVARWFASSQPVETLVVDDTDFPKDGAASPCMARQYSGTLGKISNCQVGVSVHARSALGNQPLVLALRPPQDRLSAWFPLWLRL
jgi:SRSO17 transposase